MVYVVFERMTLLLLYNAQLDGHEFLSVDYFDIDKLIIGNADVGLLERDEDLI